MSVHGALASLTIADFLRDRGSPKCINNPFCLGTETLIHTEGGQSGHLASPLRDSRCSLDSHSTPMPGRVLRGGANRVLQFRV